MKKFGKSKGIIVSVVLTLAITVLSLTSLPLVVYASDISDDSSSVFDLSEAKRQIDEIGIPKSEIVDAMLTEANSLYSQGKYAEAAKAYALYSKNANWLANILAKTCRPYYSASYDDKKNFSPTKISLTKLIFLEMLANSYKSLRNEAMAKEGLCYYYLEDYSTSLPLLLKSLDVIEVSQEGIWLEVINAVLDIVGYGGIMED